jgi:deoxyribose-phosphate aldolase
MANSEHCPNIFHHVMARGQSVNCTIKPYPFPSMNLNFDNLKKHLWVKTALRFVANGAQRIMVIVHIISVLTKSIDLVQQEIQDIQSQ